MYVLKIMVQYHVILRLICSFISHKSALLGYQLQYTLTMFRQISQIIREKAFSLSLSISRVVHMLSNDYGYTAAMGRVPIDTLATVHRLTPSDEKICATVIFEHKIPLK